MFWKYFELAENPFGLTPDPKFFYLSKPHATALEWMKFAIEQHEFGLITGEVGSGKTVISRYIIDSLDEDKYKVCWIVNPSLTPVQLLKEVYRQLFDEDPPHRKITLIKKMEEGMAELYMQGKYPVVFIDESQAIPGTKVFEQLRLLSNFQTDSQYLISIILLGQPELKKRLKRKAYRAFLQRVRYTIDLKPLSVEEVKDYITHRLKIAGGDGNQVFSEETFGLIHKLSKGYPRPLNHLASFAMMEAMTNDSEKITNENVKNAANSIIYMNNN